MPLQGTQNQVFKWSHVREAFLDIKMYLYMLQAFCIGILTGGLGTFQREHSPRFDASVRRADS